MKKLLPLLILVLVTGALLSRVLVGGDDSAAQRDAVAPSDGPSNVMPGSSDSLPTGRASSTLPSRVPSIGTVRLHPRERLPGETDVNYEGRVDFLEHYDAWKQEAGPSPEREQVVLQLIADARSNFLVAMRERAEISRARMAFAPSEVEIRADLWEQERSINAFAPWSDTARRAEEVLTPEEYEVFMRKLYGAVALGMVHDVFEVEMSK